MFPTRSENVIMLICSTGIALYMIFDAFDILQALVYAFFTITFFTLLFFATKPRKVEKNEKEEENDS